MGIVEDVLAEWRKRDPYLLDPKGFERFFEKQYPGLLRKAERETKKQIEELVRVFTAPLIVMPGGWHDTIPDWMKHEVTIRRLINLMKGNEGEATDIEACIYMYTASFQAPMGRDWTQIYLYLATKCMEEAGRGKVPEDIRVTELDDYQERQLRKFKEWIWRRQRAK